MEASAYREPSATTGFRPVARSAPAGRRPLLAAAIVAAGVAGILSVHLWSASWRMEGPSPAFAPFYLWTLMPSVVLAGLAYAGRLRSRVALALALVVELAALAGLDSVNSLTGGGAGNVIPPLLVGVVLAGWGADVRLRAWTMPARLPPAALAAWLVGLAAALVAARAVSLGDLQPAETFGVVFVSIAVEALPFVVLGAFVSALIGVLVPDRFFERVARLPLRAQVPGAALAGIAMPVCECGSVPVARRLIARGVHPAAGVAFMLASPIINPVVLLTTAVAYQGRGAVAMVLGRALLGLTVAMLAGAVLARRGSVRLVAPPAGAHDHDHDGGRVRVILDHTASELWFMGRFVVAGAALAALVQTGVPQSVFTGLLASPLIGTLVLMGVAFMLSLCSEADAFVAVSFAQFGFGPQLAFLVFGPILDIKLAMLYRASFGSGFVVRLALVAVPTIAVGALLFEGLVV